ncbi:hypothetical protein GC207_06810 [bacterium]|nr:hypothetical protein [bacterium]
MTGLVVSGVTAIPLVREVDAMVATTGADELIAQPASTDPPAWALWLTRIRDALHETDARHPILFYGTDWLAFGHIVIAITFIGAWRDPVRNAWLFDFGLIACGLVIPWALVFGRIRGIPCWWQLIDCSFGLLGAMPLLICKKLLNDNRRNTFDSANHREAAPVA